jgi:hypothetical protein
VCVRERESEREREREGARARRRQRERERGRAGEREQDKQTWVKMRDTLMSDLPHAPCMSKTVGRYAVHQ